MKDHTKSRYGAFISILSLLFVPIYFGMEFFMKKEVLLIIPSYNEEASIGNLLVTLKNSAIFDLFDVLVINDGSADKTSEIAKASGLTVIDHIYNMGYGCALQTGYKYALAKGYKYVIQIDADGQHDVSNIEILYNKLKSREMPDIVIGSRFLDGSLSFKISSLKRFIIKCFTFIISAATKTKITDPTSGLQGLNEKAFAFYSRFNFFDNDYPDANMIIQMLLNGFKIIEVPAVMHSRVAGVSMHSGLKPFVYMIKMGISIFIVILREKLS